MRLPLLILAFSAILATPERSHAQPLRLASAELQLAPDIQAEDTPTDSELLGAQLEINAPIPVSDSLVVIPGLSYHLDQIHFDHTDQDNPPLLHSFALGALVRQELGPKWALMFRANLGLAGGFREVDLGMLRGAGLASAMYSFSDRLTLGSGGLISYTFGALVPLPVLLLRWRPSEFFSLNMLAPVMADAKLRPLPWLNLGLHLGIRGNAYGMRGAKADRCYLPDSGGRCVDNIEYSVGELTAELGLRLFANLWLNPYGGVTFFRRFEAKYEDGGTAFDPDQKNGPVLGLRLEARLPPPKR